MLRAVSDHFGLPINIATSDAFMWCVQADPAMAGLSCESGCWRCDVVALQLQPPCVHCTVGLDRFDAAIML
jgi:hypothetical protein